MASLLILDTGRILFIGAVDEVPPHSSQVPIVGAGLDRDLAVTIDGSSTTGTAILVPGGVTRSVDAGGGRLAVMPIDPLQAPTQITNHEKLRFAFRSLCDVPSARADTWRGLLLELGLPSGDAVSDVVRDCCGQIEASHEDNLPAEEIASDNGISLSHLQTRFRTELGVSMRGYRTWNRFRAVAEAMMSSSTLTDAAVSAGFYDAAHFTNAFTTAFGVTPSFVFSGDLEICLANEFSSPTA